MDKEKKEIIDDKFCEGRLWSIDDLRNLLFQQKKLMTWTNRNGFL